MLLPRFHDPSLLRSPISISSLIRSHETDAGGPRYVAVLHEGPVDSPEAAARAAIVAEHTADETRQQ